MKLCNKSAEFLYRNLLQLVYWMFLFAALRFLFIIFYFKLFYESGLTLGVFFKIFEHSFTLDLSTASYFTVISFFIFLLYTISSKKIFLVVNRVYTLLLTIGTVLIYLGEIGIYKEWRSKLSVKAVLYLKNPDEVFFSDDLLKFLIKIALAIILPFLFFKVYKFLTGKIPRLLNLTRCQGFVPVLFLAVNILSPGLLILAMRGGFDAIPISVSESYFSQKDIFNDVAVNSVWNLAEDFFDNLKVQEKNIFETMPYSEAKHIVDSLHYVPADTTVKVLNSHRPNIVLIVLESFSADLIHSLGGREGISPNFDTLATKGLLFTNLYASGNRSQQGLASILGGFPALPITTLTAVPAKMRKTHTITEVLKQNGYHTMFIYGGNLRYGNIRAYILHNKFDTFLEEKDFPEAKPRGRLGIHDEYMFNKFLSLINKQQKPFFSVFFTLSSHSPYDQPLQGKINWNDSEDKFHNSAAYTDSCLGDFFRKAEQQEWYKNTIFILVADHSHQTYRHYSIDMKKYRHIPMLWLGGALRKEYKGFKYDKIASQTDLTTTLLKQLDINNPAFYWSKNLFNPYTKEFAYFELNTGFGWIKPEGFISYNVIDNRFYKKQVPSEQVEKKLLREGKAYVQVLFQTFLDL